VMADPDAVTRVQQIKDLGVRIALDDFGTGYSSMSYLQRLPIDILKIDKSFIDDIDRRADRAVLANAIVHLGRSLGLTTVAEGVEDAAQFDVLRAIGCDVIQGYLFSRPLPPELAEARLLELAGSGSSSVDTSTDGLVHIAVGPLDSAAAREFVEYAHWALDELDGDRLQAGYTSSAVMAAMRDCVQQWTVAALDEDGFVWVAAEDADVVAVMMSRWLAVSTALFSETATVRRAVSVRAVDFGQTLVQSILVALASHHDEDKSAHAATLARQWPKPRPACST